MADTSMSETTQFFPPKDLVAEAKRQPKQPLSDRLLVEGWRKSWLSRLSERLIGAG